MRILFRLTIVIVVALIGVAIYAMLRPPNLIQVIPPGQVEKSVPPEKMPLPRAEQPAAQFEETPDPDEEPVSQSEAWESAEPTSPETTDPASPPENAASPGLPDWRTDDETAKRPSSDPWQQEDMSMKFVEWDGLSEDRQLSILEKGLLQKYGDTPAVRTVIAFQRKPKHLPTSIDEAIVLAEAFVELWPSKKARQSLIELKQLKAEGFKGSMDARPAPWKN